MPPPKMSEEQILRERDNQKIIEASKKSRYLLQINTQNEKTILIHMSKAPTRTQVDCRYAFKLEIGQVPDGMKYIECWSLSVETGEENFKWRKVLGRYEDIFQIAKQQFANILQQYHTQNMRVMEFWERFRRNTFSEEAVLRSTEMVEIETCISDIIAMVTPMKVITMRGDYYPTPSPAPQWETLQHYAYAPFDDTRHIDFARLCAPKIFVNVGRLTPEVIDQYIFYWQNGKWGNNVEWIVLRDDCDVIARGLWKCRGLNMEACTMVPIRHFHIPGRRARLYRAPNEIRFFVDRD